MDYDDLTTLRQLATTAAQAKSYADSKHTICNIEYVASADNWQYNNMDVFDTKELVSLCWFLKKENKTYEPLYVKYGEKVQSIPKDVEFGVLINGNIHILSGLILDNNNQLLAKLVLTLENSYSLSLQDVSEEGL